MLSGLDAPMSVETWRGKHRVDARETLHRQRFQDAVQRLLLPSAQRHAGVKDVAVAVL